MDDDTRELVRHLFARAMALAEDCAEVTARGQHPGIEREGAVALALQLSASATALQALTNAVNLLAGV